MTCPVSQLTDGEPGCACCLLLVGVGCGWRVGHWAGAGDEWRLVLSGDGSPTAEERGFHPTGSVETRKAYQHENDKIESVLLKDNLGGRLLGDGDDKGKCKGSIRQGGC